MKGHNLGEVCAAVLMPHAPVLIPEVGGGREREAAATVASMWDAARLVVESRPDALLVISPHAPRRPGQFGIWSGKTLIGDMARFGHPEIKLELPNATSFSNAVSECLTEAGVSMWHLSGQPLDHGAFVPLYFLTRSGWTGPTAVLSLNLPGEGGWRKVGQGVRAAAVHVGIRLAIVASGDMSHRLVPGAPAGYEPSARKFDEDFVRIVRKGDYQAINQIDPALQELAAEDVVDSTLIAAHAVAMDSTGHKVLSYEGPFGVGYCVAQLYHGNGTQPPGQLLPAIAREAVEGHFRTIGKPTVVPAGEYLNRPAGVFVTIRTRDGQLRGCRGTILPRSPNVVDETRAVALSSAFQDGRFEPVTEAELEDLTYEVSVLNPAEPVASTTELDPRRYGVIVSTADGRRGLMLPEVEGLNTVEQQIEATCRKAHIDPREPLIFERFTTDKFVENGHARD